MRYKTASPYFPESDIKKILHSTRKILEGDGLLSMGDNVRRFESLFSSYIGSEFSVATNSCSGALEVVLSALNISYGDEVIVPTQTFIATGSSVSRVGAKPIFCEVNRNFLIDTNDLKRKITSKTKAVIIVHFAGLILEEILELKKYLNKKNIFLIEDAAHACGASMGNIKAGNLGDAACFSFFPTKNITTGEGGMITSNNKQLIKKCSSIRNRGVDLDSKVEQFSHLGSNYRMAEFQAILGISQLKKLKSFNKKRNVVAEIYNKILEPLEENDTISLPSFSENIFHSYWRYWFQISKPALREEIKDRMSKGFIDIDWAYTPLLHLQPIFKKMYKTKEGMLPRSELLSKSHICLPIHHNISRKDAKYIGNYLLSTFTNLGIE